MKRNHSFYLAILLLYCFIIQAYSNDEKLYQSHIIPIFKKYCMDCHGPKKQKGKFRLDTLNPDMIKGNDTAHWYDVLTEINRGQMPPDDETQPTDQERQILVEWLTKSLNEAAAANAGPSTALRRLNNTQYANTLKDLFHVDVDYSQYIPKDTISENGFKTNANALFLSSAYLEKYMMVADEILDRALPSAPPEVYRFKMEFGRNINTKSKASSGGYRMPVHARHRKVSYPPVRAPFKAHELAKEYKLESSSKGKKVVKTYKGEDYAYLAGRRFSNDYKNPDGTYVKVDGLEMPPIRATKIDGQNPSEPTLMVAAREFPTKGKFVIRIEAYKDQLKQAIKYENTSALKVHDYKSAEINLPANKFTLERNLKLVDGGFTYIKTKSRSSAKVSFNVTKEGLYILYSSYKYSKGMGSRSSIIINGESVGNTLNNKKLSIKPEALVFLKKGPNKIQIEGQLGELNFKSLAFKKVESTHSEAYKVFTSRSKLVPTMRAFAGSKIVSGQKVKFLDTVHEVHATKSKPEVYEFYGNLEEFPIPSKPGKGLYASMLQIGMENNQLISPYGPSITVKSIEFEGPYYEEWPTKAQKSIFFKSPNKSNEVIYAKEVLSRFLHKAYRRVPKNEELQSIYSYWQTNRKSFSSFHESIKNTLFFILTSPQFLYMVDPSQNSTSKTLTDFELASRLSYFLWNSMPDGQLYNHARRKTLKKSINSEVDRMLSDKRSLNFSKEFSKQWLDLEKIDLIVTEFPLYKYYLDELQNETIHFFHEIMRLNLPIDNFVHSDFVIVNQNLAAYYGFDGIYGANFRKVSSANSSRGGVITQGSIMFANSTGKHSHPIKRGVWLADRILGSPPPPPPPGVPEIDETDPKFKNLSLVEQMKVHRNYAACRDCHKKIDPWGIPFESFSFNGLVNTKAKVYPAELPGGVTVKGIGSLKKYLLTSQKEQIARALASYLLSYSIGRKLTYADKSSIKQIVNKSKAGGFRLRDIIKEIVKSKTFLSK